MPRYLANQDLYGALLDLRRGLTSLLNQLGRQKNLAGAEGVARQMDDHLGELITAIRMPRVAFWAEAAYHLKAAAARRRAQSRSHRGQPGQLRLV
jgi:hypothetical protein